jgi:hypothetical protein
LARAACIVPRTRLPASSPGRGCLHRPPDAAASPLHFQKASPGFSITSSLSRFHLPVSMGLNNIQIHFSLSFIIYRSRHAAFFTRRRIDMRWIKKCNHFLLPLLILLLAGCSSTAVSTSQTPHTGSQTSTTVTALTSTPTQNPDPVPTPPRSQVGTLPTNCHLTPIPGSKVFPQGWGGYLVDTTLIGKSPIWAQLPQNLQVQLSPSTPDNSWTGTKILWEVGPDASVAATVHVTNLATGQLAWWGKGDRPPSEPNLVLNAQDEGYHGTPKSGWNEWGSFLYLLTAGCYSMDVSWAGGSWHVVFAAGT